MSDPRRPIDDPELDALFAAEPELRDLARRLRAAAPDPVVGPHFERYLRARLMDAAATELRPRGLRRLGAALRPRGALLAGGGALVGAGLIAAVLVTSLGSPAHDRVDYVQASASVAGNPRVDPNDVITISFNRSMDHTAVEQGITIHPATAYTTAWHGNDLVITPTHHLAANTPYTVTIAKEKARDVRGNVAATPIAITFGTKPTAPPTAGPSPTGPPALTLHPLVPANPAAPLVFTGDGSLLVGGATLPAATPSPGPSATPSATAGGNGHGRPTESASASPSASPATPAAQLVRIGTDGTPTAIGGAGDALSVAPGGRLVAAIQRTDQGRAQVVVVDASTGHTTVLATTDDAASPLAWTGGESHPAVLYVDGGRLRSVDLQRTRRDVGAPRIDPGRAVALSPDGRFLYIGPALPASGPASPSATATAAPSPDGTLLDLAAGSTLVLPGSRSTVSFSADGGHVAWVDDTQDPPVLDITATSQGTPAAIATGAQAGDAIGGVSLSGDASRVAYLLTRGASTRLVLASTADGSVVGAGDAPGATATLAAPAGDRVAVALTQADATVVAMATANGASPATAADAVPAEAAALLDRVVDAQVAVGSSPSALASLVAPSMGLDLVAITPTGMSRGYVVHAARTPGADTVVAHIRLVRDPRQDHLVAAFVDETVTVDRPGSSAASYAVTAATVSPVQEEPQGPQVLHVDVNRDRLGTVVRILFDSDLDPATVAGAVTATGADGRRLTAVVSYDTDARTVVVTIPGTGGGQPVVTLATSLQDVDGEALAQPFTTGSSAQ